MASVLEVPILSVIDDATLLVLTRGLLPVTVRRLGAARRWLWRLWWRSSAADRTRRLRRTSWASPAALPAPRARLFGWLPLAVLCKKSGECRCVFLALCVRLCVSCAYI